MNEPQHLRWHSWQEYRTLVTCLHDYGGYMGIQLLHNGLLQLCLEL